MNACRAFNFAAAPWKFARKLAARPTASAERGQKKEAFLRLLIFGSGGLGLRRRLRAFFHACSLHSGSGPGGLCPHPLRKLSFLRTFLLLPPLRTRGAANPNAGASHYHNGAAPSLRTTLLQKRIAAVEPPPRRRGLRPLLRVSSWLRALPARVSDCARPQAAVPAV